MSETTRLMIRDAATYLFYAKGYHGTSVRDIAKEASVNAALVSYYFGGKQGLFESLMTDFFEGYVKTIETFRHLDLPIDKLFEELLFQLLKYQQSHHWLARMAHREMTLDSTLVRELMTTYLRKEKYVFEHLLKRGMNEGIFTRQPVDLLVIQLRNTITLPFSSPQYMRELYQLTPAEPSFTTRYMKHVRRLLQAILFEQEKPGKRVYVKLAKSK
ncbi:forespore capture DNA-binding protein RefZ [Shouchella shacheensis]|uniref:forespore capture DNA-binding protein RefZ n=1 Tax=Shouchella shacheensis TaxID=1649580 RepID=UPI00073FBC0F|nr:forespore capture DNA-binding protein RefZ [Shouchella shacheensis]